MQMQRIVFISILIFPIIVNGCAGGGKVAGDVTGEKKELFKEKRLVMGTYAEVAVYDTDKEKAARAVDEAFDEMERLDGLMSNYKTTSELSRINRDAPLAPTGCDPELLGVIEDSVRYSRLSGGAFDITVEHLEIMWGFYDGKARVPEADELAEVLPAVSYENIEIEGEGDSRLICFSHPGTRIDLAGIGKGFAVDKAVDVLKRHGITSALVNIGEDIYALGHPPDADAWKIGIHHLFGYLELKDKGVSTSLDYVRSVTINGKRYSHIFDPRTGMPVEKVVSVTVIADTAMEADALSTAAFVLGPEEGEDLLEDIDGVGGIIAYQDDEGEINFELTETAEKLFKKEVAAAQQEPLEEVSGEKK